MQLDQLDDLRGLLAQLRCGLASARLSLLERKYRPDQPRVPAGAPDGGQWTGSDGSAALIDIANRTRSPIDLRTEETAGGHAIERHVGRSNTDLVRTLQAERLDMPSETIFGRNEGSFNDLASANHYVNDVLDAHPAEVSAVASGEASDKFLVKRYASPTGREAYREDGDSTES